MNRIYLELHQEAENKHRFYQMFIVPTLFDDWSLVREWGRIGSPGTVKKGWFESEKLAGEACQKLIIDKVKKGYIRLETVI